MYETLSIIILGKIYKLPIILLVHYWDPHLVVHMIFILYVQEVVTRYI